MNEARDNLLKAAALDPGAWQVWTAPTPGLYTYNPRTSEPERTTPLREPGEALLTLRA